MDSSADVSPAPADRPRRTADPANATVLAHANTENRSVIRIVESGSDFPRLVYFCAVINVFLLLRQLEMSDEMHKENGLDSLVGVLASILVWTGDATGDPPSLSPTLPILRLLWPFFRAI